MESIEVLKTAKHAGGPSLWRFFFPELPSIDPRSRGTIPSLDGIRAISILLVLLAHCGLDHLVPGGLGVSIFFFLSGYLITTLMRREALRTGTVDLKKFYIRRCLRILPPCYIVIAVVLALDLALGAGFSWWAVLSHVFYYTNYYEILGHGRVLTGLTVLWSLAVEEHFYLLFPLLYLATLRLPRRRQGMVLVATCLAVLAWRCVLVFAFGRSSPRTFGATDTRLDSILWGCCLAILANPALKDRTSDWLARRWLSAVGMGLLLFCLVFRADWFRETFRYTLQAIALLPLFVRSIRAFDRGPFRMLNWYPVRLIGAYSYSIYLMHYAMVQGLQSLDVEHPAVLFPIVATASFAAAAVMYQFVDRPCAALRTRFAA